MYAFSFVLPNLGMAIAASRPMITSTMRISMSVKPVRFMQSLQRNHPLGTHSPQQLCLGRLVASTRDPPSTYHTDPTSRSHVDGAWSAVFCGISRTARGGSEGEVHLVRVEPGAEGVSRGRVW